MKRLLSLFACLFVVALQGFGPDVTDPEQEASASQSFQYIDFMFTDLLGSLKSITIPIDKAYGACRYGLFFDGSSVIGCSETHESDLLLKPDLENLLRLPWSSEDLNTVVSFCDICTNNGELYPDSPRTVLKQTLERAHDAGYVPYCGVELEFYVLQKNENGYYVPVDSYGYCDAIPDYNAKTFQVALIDALNIAGIDVEKIHHKGAPGQYEIVLKYDNPLKIADALIMAKYVIEAVAGTQRLIATFMPKPFSYCNGSGMHIHMSLFDIFAGGNAFYSQDSLDNLSVFAKEFVAGNLNRLQESELLFNSSVNSFKRLVPGHEVQIYGCWGKKNRSAALRIPAVNDAVLEELDGAPVRVEFRIPDGSCNPYLAFAALIEAGLQGIENHEVAPGPIEKNIYNLSSEERKALSITAIAGSLEEAISAFKKSLFMRQLLGSSLYKKLLTLREQEWDSYIKNGINDPFVISDWEKAYHGLPEGN